MKKTLLVAPLLFLAPLLSVAQQTEKVDLNTIHRIKAEALGRNSKVMDHMFYLTDVNGPRLQNSKGYRAAGDWAVKRLKEYGLSNVHLEKWGPFGKGWNLELYSGHMLEPQYQPIIAMPVAWTAGTNGVVSGNPILVTPQTQADLDAFKGKLAGKIVLISPKRDLAMVTTPLGVRYSDAELQEIQSAQIQIPGLFGRGGRGGPPGTPGGRGGAAGGLSPQAVQTFLKAEKPALVIQISARGDGGTLMGGGAQNRDVTDNLPTLVMAAEHYNRIVRLMEHEIPVKLQFEIKTSFDDVDAFNVIAELPGNAKKDELVMVGGHFDSWHYGTGATDNAAGSAIAMEVMRALKEPEPQHGPHGAPGAVGRRRARAAGIARLREGALRGSDDDEADGGAREGGGLLEYRQRDREDPRHLPAGQRNVPADFREVAGAVQGHGGDDDHQSQHGRHGSPGLRRRGPAGLPVHPGHDGLQHAHAPLQHGRVRPHPGDGHAADDGD